MTYRAPGRVNLIGEHTDYNDGFVLPVAIDRFTTVTITPREDRTLRVRSAHVPDALTLDLDRLDGGPQGTWSDYVRGVAAVLERRGFRLRGADMTIASDVPIGAGLSSSAALEVAIGYGLLDMAGYAIDRTALARACQDAEHEFAGTRCGVMDQFISCHGRAGHALMLDTRSLDAAWLPMPDGVAVIVCNTMTKHALASDGYNERRADCEAGVRGLAIAMPRIRALRDVTVDDLEANQDALPARLYRRCRHVVTENARVEAAAAALAGRRSGRHRRADARVAREHARRLRDQHPRAGPDGRRRNGGGRHDRRPDDRRRLRRLYREPGARRPGGRVRGARPRTLRRRDRPRARDLYVHRIGRRRAGRHVTASTRARFCVIISPDDERESITS